MSRQSARNRNALTRWEIVGAWLGLWTPPRGTEVPPAPWTKIAVGGAVLTALVIAVVTLVLPRLGTEEPAGPTAAERRAALAEVDRVQRARTGTGRRDPRGAGTAERVRARGKLLGAAQAAIVTDAARRTGNDVEGTDCEPFPRRPDPEVPVKQLGRRAAVYQCVAVTSRFEGGVIGIPFRLVVRFAEGRYAFCRVMPLGDRDRLSHPLPGACRL